MAVYLWEHLQNIFIECLFLNHMYLVLPNFCLLCIVCVCVKKQVFQTKNNLHCFKVWDQKWPQLPQVISLLSTHPLMVAGDHPLFVWVPLWAVRPTCVLTCHLLFVPASGSPADLAQAAAQRGFGAAGFQLPWPVCQRICSGLFEADEVGKGFWGAKLHSLCSQDKTTPRGKS